MHNSVVGMATLQNLSNKFLGSPRGRPVLQRTKKPLRAQRSLDFHDIGSSDSTEAYNLRSKTKLVENFGSCDLSMLENGFQKSSECVNKPASCDVQRMQCEADEKDSKKETQNHQKRISRQRRGTYPNKFSEMRAESLPSTPVSSMSPHQIQRSGSLSHSKSYDEATENDSSRDTRLKRQLKKYRGRLRHSPSFKMILKGRRSPQPVVDAPDPFQRIEGQVDFIISQGLFQNEAEFEVNPETKVL